MKSKQSNERMFNQFKEKDIFELTLIQNAYINKNANEIRVLLNKPDLSDSSAIGQGNLCNQYIKSIKQPDSSSKRYIEKNYDEQLSDSSNERENLEKNISILKQSVDKKSLFPFPNYQKGVNYKHNSIELEKNSSFPAVDLCNKQIKKFMNHFSEVKTNKYIFARLTLQYELSDKSIHYISTVKSTISNFAGNISYIYDMVVYKNSGEWKRISPEIRELVDEIYNQSVTFARYTYCKIEYYK